MRKLPSVQAVHACTTQPSQLFQDTNFSHGSDSRAGPQLSLGREQGAFAIASNSCLLKESEGFVRDRPGEAVESGLHGRLVHGSQRSCRGPILPARGCRVGCQGARPGSGQQPCVSAFANSPPVFVTTVQWANCQLVPCGFALKAATVSAGVHLVPLSRDSTQRTGFNSPHVGLRSKESLGLLPTLQEGVAGISAAISRF